MYKAFVIGRYSPYTKIENFFYMNYTFDIFFCIRLSVCLFVHDIDINYHKININLN